MKKTFTTALFIVLIPLGGLFASEAEYVVIETPNPTFCDNTVFSEPEDLTAEGFEVIRSRYNLKEIVKGKKYEIVVSIDPAHVSDQKPTVRDHILIQTNSKSRARHTIPVYAYALKKKKPGSKK